MAAPSSAPCPRLASSEVPKSTYISDPIHGLIKLDPMQLSFVDTPQFQRLRDLKQLGSSYWVFPGASHNRFEHSIGVSHLADRMINSIKSHQPDLDISDDQIESVRLAGLLHDLGHGPFSHIFDSQFIPRARGSIEWKHEQASEKMLDYLIDENSIDIKQEQVRLIKQLISGDADNSNQPKFLFDIVANKRTSVDVDKFDYIARDCLNVGTKDSYDFERLIVNCRVLDDQVCFHAKEVYNLYEMFHTRYSLFKRVYTHRVGKAVELMIVDALLEADPVLRISDAIDDMREYMKLTDNILRDIENSRDERLKKAREIVMRLRRRQLYRLVDEVVISPEKFAACQRAITPENIASERSDLQLKTDDIIVDFTKVSYSPAHREKNPIDSIRFFSRYEEKKSFTLDRNAYSYLVPERYEEIVLRIFTRDEEKRVVCASQLDRIFWAIHSIKEPLSHMQAVQNASHACALRTGVNLSRSYQIPEDYLSPKRPHSHSSQTSPSAEHRASRRRLDFPHPHLSQ